MPKSSTAKSEFCKPDPKPYAVLIVSVLAVSTGAIFVRLADAPHLVKAAYRVGLAFLVVLPIALATSGPELRALSARQVKLAALSGLFLAAHFATWIASLDYTSVANSTVLVNTIPLWVGLLTPLVTRDRISRAAAVGMVLSVVGAITIGAADFAASAEHLWGDLLAVTGGICAAAYLLIGRNLRRELSLPAYVAVCYGSSAAILWILVLMAGLPIAGYTPKTYGVLLAMALVSQVLGHTAYNWSLRWLSAGLISVSLLGEPILSTLWAYLLFGEGLTWIQVAGGVLILIGIHRTASAERPLRSRK